MVVRRLLMTGLALAAVGALPAQAGIVDFRNDEFNFRTTFPAGSQICPAVAANHTFGYYAWYGQATACDIAKPDATSSTMGVYATYNTAYQRSALTLLPKVCRPVPPKPVAAPSADGKPAPATPAPAVEPQPVAAATLAPSSVIDAKTLSQLAFRRYKSVQCATVQPDGSIDIDVITQAGKWVDGNDPGFQTPLVNYRASLHTAPDRLDKDLAMFRTFLQKVDIRY